jgi:hypothetical protein
MTDLIQILKEEATSGKSMFQILSEKAKKPPIQKEDDDPELTDDDFDDNDDFEDEDDELNTSNLDHKNRVNIPQMDKDLDEDDDLKDDGTQPGPQLDQEIGADAGAGLTKEQLQKRLLHYYRLRNIFQKMSIVQDIILSVNDSSIFDIKDKLDESIKILKDIVIPNFDGLIDNMEDIIKGYEDILKSFADNLAVTLKKVNNDLENNSKKVRIKK